MILSNEEIKSLFDYVENSKAVTDSPIDKKYVHKLDPTQVVISEINQIPDNAIREFCHDQNIHSIYLCMAKPNLECKVCFDHPLDHYPLMKQFEIIRQFGIASCHTHYNVPLEGWISIANKIHFDYLTFGELDAPLLIFCVDTNVEISDGFLKKRDCQFFYVQRGKLCAFVEGTLTTMKRDLYYKLRKISRCKMMNIRKSDTIPTNIDVLVKKLAARAVS